MPRFSIKQLLAFTAIVVLCLAPVAFLANHLRTWQPAERTEDMLSGLYQSVLSAKGNVIPTIQDIDQHLKRYPHFKFLRENRDPNIKLLKGELAWFSPNKKYSIGLHENGQKLWIVDGVRK